MFRFLSLKTIAGETFRDRQTALLIEPDLKGKVKNNEELYAEIRKHDKIVIVPWNPENPLETLPPETLTPEQFCSIWQGD